ncbi:citrate/2-methylcitrate synthase [Candidatus Lokiarchaeum ossiferum]|uniref:citrate/2-methylcitrate synthase n=1 Tax=Candidatus Lokiarchaeum ossiferum TaxID=2951803 RepID=UPI00352EACF8
MEDYELFNEKTQAIVYGFQTKAIQRMIDFDYVCRRETPSVAAVIRPTQGPAVATHKVFFGVKEIIIPVYKSFKLAAERHPNADVVVNFASFRSSFETSKEALETDSIRTVAIIAEGIPERQSRILGKIARDRNKMIIGPATVGGIRAGAFKIGNTAGTTENVILSKMYRPGSVGFVSKSGGMSNEMNFMIAQNSDGIFESIAIGGDRYPGASLIDHLLRYEKNPKIKMLVCLGEIGGTDEYKIVEALKTKQITKPLVIWVTGTAAKILPKGLQFGHAGAMAGSDLETAEAKNKALKEAGAHVPSTYDHFGELIAEVFNKLKSEGKIEEIVEVEPPKIPMDFAQALKEGLVRRPTDVVVSISDDRGDVPTYNKKGLDDIIKENKSLGYVIGMLWFKKELPDYAQEYVEMVIKLTADHGPAVSGAHNAIVTARAGKDLMSSLATGILTIGPRFGGAISDGARYFRMAYDKGMSPTEFISYMKKVEKKNIPGIGHRIKSVQNPDVRVVLLKDYVMKNFPKHPYLDYALEVEKLTTSKRNNLILNVDGCIGICFLDLLENLDFTTDEKDDVISSEALNGLFVLGRSIGMMGHVFDQKRQRSRLYRQPWDEILYD